LHLQGTPAPIVHTGAGVSSHTYAFDLKSTLCLEPTSIYKICHPSPTLLILLSSLDYHLLRLRLPHLPEFFVLMAYLFSSLTTISNRISDSHSHLQNRYLLRSFQKHSKMSNVHRTSNLVESRFFLQNLWLWFHSTSFYYSSGYC
jgi:hypothetical protein